MGEATDALLNQQAFREDDERGPMTAQDSRDALAQRLAHAIAKAEKCDIANSSASPARLCGACAADLIYEARQARAILSDGSRSLPPTMVTHYTGCTATILDDEPCDCGAEDEASAEPAPTADAVEALATALHDLSPEWIDQIGWAHGGPTDRSWREVAEAIAYRFPSGWSLRGPEDAALVEIGRAVQRLPKDARWFIDLYNDGGDANVVVSREGGHPKGFGFTIPEAVDRALASERAAGEEERG